MDHIFQDIPGWFDWHETYARWARDAPRDAVIVEVGTFKGRSAAFMSVALARLGRTDVRFLCVDTWQGAPELLQFADVRDGSFYDIWQQTRARLQEIGAVVPVEMRMPSTEAATHFRAGEVWAVWLDGAHDFANVQADCEAWWPTIAPGGEMGGHDWNAFEVAPAVTRFAQRQGRYVQALAPFSDRTLAPHAGESWLMTKPIPSTNWGGVEGQRSVLLCPVTTTGTPMVFARSAKSLMEVMLYTGHHLAAAGWRAECYWSDERFTVDAARDDVLLQAITRSRSHVLFLDTDQTWPVDAVLRLLAQADRGMVGGLYPQKRWPFRPVAFRDLEEAHPFGDPHTYAWAPYIHEERTPQEMAAYGMGCTLVPIAAVEQIPRPWFQHRRDAYGFTSITEDMYFCEQMRAIGCPLWIDPTIRCGHVAVVEVTLDDYESRGLSTIERAARQVRRLRQSEATR